MAKKSSRRDLIKAAAFGSVAAGFGLGASSGAEAQEQDHNHDHVGTPVKGPLASATVSFGSWPANPANPLDRNPNRSPGSRNGHQLVPHEVTIKAGGTVNFIIAGFHWVAVYGDGTQPSDIVVNPSSLFIDDPTKRIYRGLDPSALTILTNAQPNAAAPLAPVVIPAIAAVPGVTVASPAFFSLGVRDRVEVVQFPEPGRYLVICLIRPHFTPAPGQFEMFGHVKVIS